MKVIVNYVMDDQFSAVVDVTKLSPTLQAKVLAAVSNGKDLIIDGQEFKELNKNQDYNFPMMVNGIITVICN